MNALLILIVLCIPVLAVVGVLVGVIALLRLSGLERRLSDLERQPLDLVPLRRRLALLEERVGDGGESGDVAEPAQEPPRDEEAVETQRSAAPQRERKAERPPVPPSPPPVPPVPPRPEMPPAPAGDASPAAAAASSARRRWPDVSWEQWIGVRGAAVAGGVVLALAALLLFQYTIEQGLMTPTLRVVIGLAAGIGCLLASERLLSRSQPAAANALAGAGVVALYASLWAARSLYGLLGVAPAFALMILVTVTCGLLALRRSSLLVAVLGLAGGFATPLLLAADADRPLTLFGYVLLLDAGLLWLAHRRRWPALAALALAGTALHQGLWILGRMDVQRVLLGLGVLAVSAAAFLFAGRDAEGPLWRLTMAGAVAVPFAFALHFAGTAGLGEHLAPVGGLLVLLAAAASWLTGRLEAPLLGLGGVAACLGVVALWFTTHTVSPSLAWEGAAVAVALAAVHHLAAELTGGAAARDRAAALATGGFLGLLVIAAAATPAVGLTPWLSAWVVLAALAVRGSRFPEMEWLQVVAGGVVAGGIVLFTVSRTSGRLPAAWLLAGVVVTTAVAAQAVWLVWRDAVRRQMADHAAALTAAVLLAAAAWGLAAPGSLWPLVTASMLGVLVALAATRLGSGSWYSAAVGGTAVVHWWWVTSRVGRPGQPVAGALAIECATVAAFVGWPLVVRSSFAGSRAAWWAAALAGPLWFEPLRRLYVTVAGAGTIGLLPIGLALLALAATGGVHRVLRQEGPGRASAAVWFPAVALSFVSVAIPLQLDREWITIGWAVNGLAVIALWRRLDHPGLKYFGLVLLGAAGARLVANPAVLDYHPGSGLPVLNWLMYTYLVPAAALLGSAALLRPLELGRVRSWERELYWRPVAVAATACGLAAVVVGFCWINLTIVDAFAGRGPLALSLERLPARDLVTSIAWALYALVLLVAGMRRRSLALRWLSLLLFVATIGKVFLHDLGQLRDLYRVASLFGLAMALILVSLFYQRHVLGATPTEDG